MKKIKKYGIVSQGVLIYTSKDFFKVEKMVDNGNEQYLKDYQKAIDAGERPADNRLFLVEINSDDEKN